MTIIKTGIEAVHDLLFVEPLVEAKKHLKLVWRCHQLLFGFLAMAIWPE